MNEGKIVQIIGPVVDVDFETVEQMPKIYDALEVDYSVNGASHHLVFEVQQHLAKAWFGPSRCLRRKGSSEG